MRRILALWLLAIAAVLTGCGGGHASPTRALQHRHAAQIEQANRTCPQAASGDGHMGVCVPAQIKAQGRPPAALGSFPTYPDLSNNDPVLDMAPIRAHGHLLVVLKANQGGYIDRYFAPMAADAHLHGLCVGGYDFAQDYTANEAWIFVGRLHAAGIYRNSTCTAPPTIDVEYGAFSIGGLKAMIHVVLSQYGRVNIYTGCWYWSPHAGSFWPAGVTAWLSGYPNALRCAGIAPALYTQHQYTDNGFNGSRDSDMNIYLGSVTALRTFMHAAPVAPSPQLVAKWKAERRATLHRYHVSACKSSSTGPRCTYWRKREHALYTLISRSHA